MIFSLLDLKNRFSELKIIRNAEFGALGLTLTDYQNRKGLTYLNSEKYLDEFLANSGVTCLICTEEIEKKVHNENLGICIAEDPKSIFFRIHNYLFKETNFYGKKEKSKISPSAVIHPTAYIDDYNVIIGDHVVIEPNATVLSNVDIKSSCLIKAGSVIGGGGFQVYRDGDDLTMVEAGGSVHIFENVEIGNNTCIDKGIFGGSTLIGHNSKIDNLVHIGHDARIGKNCIITANSLISGRTVLEDNVWVGVSSVISNGLLIKKNAKISIGAVVTKNVEEAQQVSGNFAIDHKKYLSFLKTIR